LVIADHAVQKKKAVTLRPLSGESTVPAGMDIATLPVLKRSV